MPRTVAALALLLLFAAAPARAASDAERAWKAEVRRLERLVRAYWKEYQKRWVDAEAAFWHPVREARSKTDEHPNPLFDYDPFLRLYEDFAKLQSFLGAADLAFARSGDPAALEELFDVLLDVAKEVDRLDKELREGRRVQHDMFDQEPSIARHGLAQRADALVDALAACPGAAAFLAGDGWKQAVRKDGRRSIVRRVAVLDALARTPDPAARDALEPHLGAEESWRRVAALEAMLRFGPAAREALVPLLDDPNPIVRRALLDGVRASGAGDGRWIGPVLARYESATGALREDCVRTLATLTNQRFGHAPAKWKEWYAVYREEIAGGNFDRTKIEIQEVEPAPLADPVAFYGIPTASVQVVLALDGSRRISWPAAWDVQKTRYKWHWDRTRRSWEEEHVAHQTVFLRAFDRFTASLPEGATFGFVGLHSNFLAETFGERKPLSPDKPDVRRIRKEIEDLPADGWCSPLAGLFAAARVAGMEPGESADFPEPRMDTVYLVHSGDPAGGRYVNPDAVVAAFRRFNRFRRLRVHAIRICNDGPASEAVMQGIAEASGGTYLWAARPPG